MVFIRVVLESRGQVEAVIQGRIILEVAVVEEVAHEQVILVIDRVVQAQQYIVIVGVACDIEVLKRKTDPRLELIDRIDFVQDDRVVIWRLTAALALVIAKEKSPVLDNRATEGEAELVLAQLVELVAAARAQVSGHAASQWVGRSKNTARIHFVVAEVFVCGAMEFISATLGDDVNDAADSAPELGAVAAVNDPKFAHRFLGRG